MTVRRAVADFQVADPQASRRFYVELLGFEVGMDQGWIVTFVAPKNPTAQVSLLTHDATASQVPQLTVEVDDVDGVYASAVSFGLEIVHPLTDEPWGVRRFFVRDPNGTVVNVMGHGSRSEAGA